MFIICKFNHLWKKKLFTSLYSYLLPKSWEKYRPVYEVEFEWIMINYPEFYRFKEIFHINVSYQILRCSCFSWPDYYQIPEISLINIIPQSYSCSYFKAEIEDNSVFNPLCSVSSLKVLYTMMIHCQNVPFHNC